MMIDGIVVRMGGREWVVPPLTLGQLRKLMPKVRELSNIGADMEETQISALVEIVSAALMRNYTEATTDLVENLLDLGNAGDVLKAVLTGSGLKVSAPGEEAAVTSLNGATSMAFSPPPADIDTPTSTQ
jgi:hypothetical protein